MPACLLFARDHIPADPRLQATPPVDLNRMLLQDEAAQLTEQLRSLMGAYNQVKAEVDAHRGGWQVSACRYCIYAHWGSGQVSACCLSDPGRQSCL